MNINKGIVMLEIDLDDRRVVGVELSGTEGSSALLTAVKTHAIQEAVIRAVEKALPSLRSADTAIGEVQMRIRVHVGGVR
jgi:hypothetical protein